MAATQRQSCNGGPSTNPNVDLYASAKKEMIVEIVYRRPFFDGESGGISLACMSAVAIAVWVTLRGIIIFFTGMLSRIWAASARWKGEGPVGS